MFQVTTSFRQEEESKEQKVCSKVSSSFDNTGHAVNGSLGALFINLPIYLSRINIYIYLYLYLNHFILTAKNCEKYTRDVIL